MDLIDKLTHNLDKNGLVVLSMMLTHIGCIGVIIIIAIMVIILMGCSPWDLIKHWG